MLYNLESLNRTCCQFHWPIATAHRNVTVQYSSKKFDSKQFDLPSVAKASTGTISEGSCTRARRMDPKFSSSASSGFDFATWLCTADRWGRCGGFAGDTTNRTSWAGVVVWAGKEKRRTRLDKKKTANSLNSTVTLWSKPRTNYTGVFFFLSCAAISQIFSSSNLQKSIKCQHPLVRLSHRHLNNTKSAIIPTLNVKINSTITK